MQRLAGWDCATFKAPRHSYGRPGAGRADRGDAPAGADQANRIGSLFVNHGGPGG